MNKSEILAVLIGLINFGNLAELTEDCQSWNDQFVDPDCHYNPDAGKDVDVIIQRLIGTNQFYEVATEDGYILGVFRMPREDPIGVILLQHPLTVDSKVWLLQGQESPAFLFWKTGYDVWLSNNRGTTYSRKHTNLRIPEATYWNYSFHEIGIYDHPAVISLIKRETNTSQIIYIAHSMGATSGLIFASLKPQEAARDVKIFVELAPPAFFKYRLGVMPSAAYSMFVKSKAFLDRLSTYSVLRHNAPGTIIFRLLFAYVPIFKKLMMLVLILLFGGQLQQWDPIVVNTLVRQFGSEVSVKTFEHYAQFLLNGDFCQFDYGQKSNLDYYGSSKPPSYPLSNISTPHYFIYGKKDSIVRFKNVEYLYEQLPDSAKKYGKLKVDHLGHTHFLDGVFKNSLVYEPLISFLDNI